MFKKIAKNVDGRSTQESIYKQVQEILDHYHVNGLLDIFVEEEFGGYRVRLTTGTREVDLSD